MLTHESQEVVRLKTYCNKELDNIVNIYNGHLQGVLFSEVHCNLEGGGASMARPLLEKAEKASDTQKIGEREKGKTLNRS